MIALVRVKYEGGKESIFKVPYKTMFTTARLKAMKKYPQRRIKRVHYIKKRGSEGQHPLVSEKFAEQFVKRMKKPANNGGNKMRIQLILEGNSEDLRRTIDGITMYNDEVKVISEKRLNND